MGDDDNWSLKGQDVSIQTENFRGEKGQFNWYLKTDIETLRQKLIEDLYSIMKEDIERITLSYRGYPDIKPMPEIRMTVTEVLSKTEKIINKRFGVE